MQQRSVHPPGSQPMVKRAPARAGRPASAAPATAAPVPSVARRNAGRDARFGHDLSDVRVYPDTNALSNMHPHSLAGDLSKPGDESEQEAERVSFEVMSGNSELPEISAQPAGINRMLAGSDDSPLGSSLIGQLASGLPGLGGAASSAAGWMGDTTNQALSGGLNPAFLGSKAMEAGSGIAGMLGQASPFGLGTGVGSAITGGLAQADGLIGGASGAASGVASPEASAPALQYGSMSEQMIK